MPFHGVVNLYAKALLVQITGDEEMGEHFRNSPRMP
jgi:hypothetical protein